MPKSKRSQSEVITTVLLILVVITSVIIVMNFVVPFVKKQLSGSDCFNVVDKIEIVNNDMYTCYNSTTKKLNVQVHIADIASKIKGFSISVGGASSSMYFVNSTAATGPTVITMYGGSTSITLPGENQERTYTISSIDLKPDNLKVYPVLNDGRTCESSTSINNVAICDR